MQIEKSVKPKILIVDDKPANLFSLAQILKEVDAEIIQAEGGNQALAATLQHEFSLAILDIQMPEMDGYELAEWLRSEENTKELPIIFVSAVYSSDYNVFKGYATGAVDFLTKPFKPQILLSKVKVFLQLYRQKIELRKTSEMLARLNETLELKVKEKTEQLKETILKLESANRTIVEKQKSLVEDERLKVLLQVAGTTAHELNQPLTVMLGNIEYIQSLKDDPAELADCLSDIQDAGRKMAEIVKKIQGIRNYETKPYLKDLSIINLEQSIRILSVEDNDDDFERIRSAVADNPLITLVRAHNIRSAVNQLNKEKYNLILLDHILPDGDSFDFQEQMMENKIDVPLIIVTGQGDEIVASRMIMQGAFDYIPKARLTESSLNRSIVNVMEKARLRHELQALQEKLLEMAIEDKLTGLPNRRYFQDAIEKEIARAKRYGNEFVFCFLDLDHFKNVNDTYGHQVGDMVLKTIGNIIKETLRTNDSACRYGGEEFALLIAGNLDEALLVSERLREDVAAYPFRQGDIDFQVTISIGIAQYGSTIAENSEDLIKRADEALYEAKENGRNNVTCAPVC